MYNFIIFNKMYKQKLVEARNLKKIRNCTLLLYEK